MFLNVLELELDRIEIQSKRTLGSLFRATSLVGLNARTLSNNKYLLKFVFGMFLFATFIGWLGVVSTIWQQRYEPFQQYADIICSTLQSVISIIKMIYFQFMERQFCELLEAAQKSQVLRSLELLDLDIKCKYKLIHEIGNILTNAWRDVQRQLNFYIFVTFLICGWYILGSIVINIYNYCLIEDVANFQLTFPVPTTYTLLFKSYEDIFICKLIQYICTAMTIYIAGVGMYLGMALALAGVLNAVLIVCKIFPGGIAFDGIFIVLTVHALAMLQVLCQLLSQSTEWTVPQELRPAYMKHCISFHERIFTFYNNIQRIFRLITLYQFCLSLLILCMVLYQASIGLETNMALFVKMVFYLSAAGFEIIIYCYNGQRLTNQSELIPLAWYKSRWYNENKDIQFYVNMMILRTNREMILSVGGFATMSLETLLAFMQTCGSYFLLLRNVNGKD